MFELVEKIGKLLENRTYQLLLAVLFLGFLVRLFFLPVRWVNPDEGAHLYDAKFVLEGKIPFVDYHSRMPIYVYLLAGFLKVFGVSYLSGRFLPLFSSIGIGITIFFIANRLFDNKVALLASFLYIFSPLSLLWSVVVKTELPATFFVSLGMFFLLDQFKSGRTRSLVLAGFLFAVGYYVRKSALMFLLTTLLILIYYYRRNIFKVFKTYGAVLMGFFLVVVLVFTYFSSQMGITSTLESSLNPVESAMIPVFKITGLLNESNIKSKKILDSEFRVQDQPWTATINEWKKTLKLNLFLVLGLVSSWIISSYDL